MSTNAISNILLENCSVLFKKNVIKITLAFQKASRNLTFIQATCL